MNMPDGFGGSHVFSWPRREDDGHAIVDRLHDFVGGRREDGEGDGGALGIAKLVVAAARVDAGHRERFAGFQHDAIRLLRAVCERLPFIEAVGEHHAVAARKLSRNMGFSSAVSRRALFCGRMREFFQSSRTKPHFASSMRSGACVRMMGRSCDGAAL